jgi:ubiquinone/menaquinone biosynthesis C-methylase UbiE
VTNKRLLEEIALAGPEHLDAAYVARYERKAGVDPTDDLDDLRARGLGPESTLIDLGAGTGVFAVAASSICKRVIAVDVSTAMVDAMKAKVAENKAINVECVLAGFLSYEHHGALADFIYTRNALHHLPDFWKGIALKRMADVLAPGGTLRLRDLVFSFDLPEAEARIAKWLDTAAVDSPEDGWTRAELETHLRDEYSTFSWLLEPLIRQAGFEIDASDYGTAAVHAAYTCIKPKR